MWVVAWMPRNPQMYRMYGTSAGAGMRRSGGVRAEVVSQDVQAGAEASTLRCNC